MFNRFQAIIRDYFGFSHRESRGFVFLLFLTLLCLCIPFLYRYVGGRKPTDTSAADQRKLDSLVILMKTEEAKQPAFANSSEKDKTTAERFTEPKLFAFDPNTVSVSGWQQLGLPRWLAERIDKYRSKGGKFRKKEDLLRIYDFPPDLYDQLEPYMKLADRPSSGKFLEDRLDGSAVTGRPYTSDRYKANSHPTFAERPVKPVVQPFDINMADTAQLVALKGIGFKLAGRIIKFRDALGGFIAPEQFRDIYGLDSLALEELQKFGKIQSAPHRIPINTASAEELDRHPFLSRRQAEIIVRYREQHGAYTSAESLKPIRILDGKTIEKIAPYLEF